MGLAGITINEAREKIIDFSHSTLHSGLLISVNRNRNRQNFFKTVKAVFMEDSKIIKSVLPSVLAFIYIFANLLWFVERNADTFNTNYFPGIFEAMWLVVVSMSTVGFGDYVPQTWLGRIITSLVITGGVAVFGLLVAQFSAFLAIKKVRGEINTSRDLANKEVATVEGSTSETFLRKIGAKVIAVSKSDRAYAKLQQDTVDAVVFDAPVAVYHKKTDKDNIIEIVGEMFNKQDYGIALQHESPWREKINLALLKVRESGQYDDFYRSWFGDDLMMEV